MISALLNSFASSFAHSGSCPALLRILRGLSFSGCLLVTTQALPDTDQHVPGDAVPLIFEECTIGTDGQQMKAECATLDALLDPDNPSLGTLPLAIARIKARQRNKHADALTFIAGGPGQSALDTFPSVSFAFRHIMRDRDVILLDQRGTGASSKLSCPESTDALGSDLAFDANKIADQAKRCLASLPADPTLFTTSIAVKDLEAIRQALGISQWNLYGVSYGTRVAQHYLRRYPESVRSMILDAVVPPEISLGPDIAAMAQRALDLLFERCQADDGCGQAFGQLDTATVDLLDELERRPRSIDYEDIARGTQITREFSRDELAATLRLMTYNSQTAAILPSMLFEAIAHDNFAPLARQADLQSDSLNNLLATGMHQAILCTEDEPYTHAQAASGIDPIEQSEKPGERSYLGDSIVPALQATCKNWPAGYIDNDFKNTVTSDKPALILSGEADPITPPEYGEQVAATLANSLHVVNPSLGHMQAPFGCMPVLMAQFVETANSTSLNTTCLDRISPTPFFIDANGPLP